jgi:hypothetical protein
MVRSVKEDLAIRPEKCSAPGRSDASHQSWSDPDKRISRFEGLIMRFRFLCLSFQATLKSVTYSRHNNVTWYLTSLFRDKPNYVTSCRIGEVVPVLNRLSTILWRYLSRGVIAQPFLDFILNARELLVLRPGRFIAVVRVWKLWNREKISFTCTESSPGRPVCTMVSFTPLPLYLRRKSPWYPLDRRLGGPQSRSSLHRKVKMFTLPGLELPLLGRTARSQ